MSNWSGYRQDTGARPCSTLRRSAKWLGLSIASADRATLKAATPCLVCLDGNPCSPIVFFRERPKTSSPLGHLHQCLDCRRHLSTSYMQGPYAIVSQQVIPRRTFSDNCI